MGSYLMGKELQLYKMRSVLETGAMAALSEGI